MSTPNMTSLTTRTGTDAGLGDSFSHAAMAAGVAIMVSNSIGVKRPSAA